LKSSIFLFFIYHADVSFQRHFLSAGQSPPLGPMGRLRVAVDPSGESDSGMVFRIVQPGSLLRAGLPFVFSAVMYPLAVREMRRRLIK